MIRPHMAGKGQVTFRIYFNHLKVSVPISVWAFFHKILEHIYLQSPPPAHPAATRILVTNQGNVTFVKLRIFRLSTWKIKQACRHVPTLWALYCPDFRKANIHEDIGGAMVKTKVGELQELLGSSLHARRHRVRPNLDREWYHVMASSASIRCIENRVRCTGS